MLTEGEKLRLLSSYLTLERTGTSYHKEAMECVISALKTDILDGGHRFEDLYIATLSIYG